jgi:glycosyltransferase involved in cell wall biosynthesis
MNITFLINAHREGLLLHSALLSARSARALCDEAGLSTEVILVADRPDQATRMVIEAWSVWLTRIELVDYGNLGSSRMHGIDRASGDFLCFLDGDDLWQPEWPSRAYATALNEHGCRDTIYHTEIFATFGTECSLREQIASDDLLFHPNHLVGSWHYCNNLFASRDIFIRYPIRPYDHDRGYGSEDWHWSCETCNAGVRRSWIPRTVYFYRRDPNRSSLGKTAWLAIRETELFRTDPIITTYSEFLMVQRANDAVLREFNAIKRSRPSPDWLVRSVAEASKLDPDIWSLRNGLAELRVESPRIYAIVAAAFGEMRRLYDEYGNFGIVVISDQDREPGDLARFLRTISGAASKRPLVVALDRSICPDQPIWRENNLLFLDVSFVFHADGSVAYSLRQLFITAIVQLKPLFFLCVEHWLGECLSPFRSAITEQGVRFAYIGNCIGDPFALRAVLSRVRNGAAWYNEIWFAIENGQQQELDELQGSSSLILVGMVDFDTCQVLDAALEDRRPIQSRDTAGLPGRLEPAPHLAASMPLVTCVLNVHREQEILIPTLSSILRMLAFTQRMDMTSELVLVRDDSDGETKELASRFALAAGVPTAIIDVEQRDLAAARNAGIAAARGKFICLLDADDLYSENWVVAALAAIEKADGENTVVHPALNVYFGSDRRYFQHPVWDSPDVPKLGLLFENYWTSLSFGRASLYQRIPFAGGDATTGFGFEDWHWNMQVIADGGTHIIAERTCHFIRLKEHGSLNKDSADRRCLVRPSRLVQGLLRS